eukprot:2230877-Pleurochrysis_carterae.AAC.1
MAPRKRKSQSSSENQPTQPVYSQQSQHLQSPAASRPADSLSRQRSQTNPAAGSSTTQATQPVSPPPARRG